jgi:uncharacterized membrane protein
LSVNETGGHAAVEPRQPSLRLLSIATVILMLGGGILLDIDRVNAVRDKLDRVAHVAAIEAAANPRAGERALQCRRRFEKAVWTGTEVALDDVSISIDRDADGRTASVTYDATVKLAVGRFFGFDEVSISGETEVSAPERQAALTTP